LQLVGEVTKPGCRALNPEVPLAELGVITAAKSIDSVRKNEKLASEMSAWMIGPTLYGPKVAELVSRVKRSGWAARKSSNVFCASAEG